MKAVISTASTCFCPYCKSAVERRANSICCLNCKTLSHHDCWKENHGCSVFGCTEIVEASPNIIASQYGSEPGWLIFFRVIVFGFFPFTIIAFSLIAASFLCVPFLIPWLIWIVLFIPSLPILIIMELIYLRRVLKKPELRTRFGRKEYHVISLSIYGIAATAGVVLWILK